MTHIISFRAEQHVHYLLEAFASQTHLTKTKIINQALDEYLQKVNSRIEKQVEILRKIEKDEDYLNEEI